MPSNAEPSEMVVMAKVPVCVVGDPAYMYWMLLAVVCVRLALRSILKLRMGSSVRRSCKSSVKLVVAGVATLSFCSSQPLLRAFPI